MACRSPKFGTVLTHSDYGLFVCGPEKSQKCLQSFHEICFQYGFRNGVSLWGRTRIRRREREEELPPVEEIEASPEEVELSDFPDGLGPQGISEVSLYRLLPSIEDSSEVPQVWRLRSEGSWTSHDGSSVDFLGDGTIFGGDGTNKCLRLFLRV